MSFCSDTQSASDLIWCKSSASSANNLIVPDMSLLMSFIYVKNMSGPSTVPWGTPSVGTPESTGTSCDALPSTTTRCVWHDRYVLSHSCASHRTPLASNFFRRWRWGTLSNAFWRSSNMISCFYFWSIPFLSCSVVVTSCVSQLSPFWNTCWVAFSENELKFNSPRTIALYCSVIRS